jgi:hypothetical protein
MSYRREERVAGELGEQAALAGRLPRCLNGIFSLLGY